MTAPKLRGSCSLQVCSELPNLAARSLVTQAGVCGGVLATERFGAKKMGGQSRPLSW